MTTPNPSELPHTVKRNPITKSIAVHFACPACKAALHAPVADAGLTDQCPECGGGFRVPGAEARRAEDQKRAAEEAKRTAADAEEATRKAAEEAAAQARFAVWEARMTAAARGERKAEHAPQTEGVSYLGLALVGVGIAVLIVGLAMDTSVDGIHNVGLLNARATTITCGCLTLFTGCVLFGLGRVGQEINRWGRAITDRLDAETKPRQNE